MINQLKGSTNVHSQLFRYLVLGLLAMLLSFVLSEKADATHRNIEYQIFEQNQKKGLLDDKKKVIIPAKYDDLGWSEGNLVIIEGVIGYKENGLWGLINLRNEKVIVPHYTQLEPYKELIIAGKRNKDNQREVFGLINAKGNEVLSFDYAHLTAFDHKLIAAVYDRDQIKYGLITEENETLVPFEYRQIKALSPSLAQIDRQGRLGLINPAGRVVAETKYQLIKPNPSGGWQGKPLVKYQLRDANNNLLQIIESGGIRPLDKNIYQVTTGEHWAFRSLDGKTIKAYYGFEVGPFQHGFSVTSKNGKVGLIDILGSPILPPIYDSISIDPSHFLVLSKGKWTVLDHSGKTISERQYDQIYPSDQGLFPVQRQGSWGLMDSQGIEKIPPQYQNIGLFQNGISVASYFGSNGVIDVRGNWLVKPRYEDLNILDQKHFLFHHQDRNGLINAYGQEVYSTTHQLTKAANAFIQDSPSGQKGLVTIDGRVLLPVAFEQLDPIQDHPDLFTYQDSLGVNIISLDRSLHLKLDLQEVKGFSEDFFAVKLEDQYGFIDHNGKLRIANRYNDVDLFSEGKAAVKIRQKWGYIDKIERIRVQPGYDHAAPFKNGIAQVRKDGKWGLIDEFGKVLLPLQYDELRSTEEGKFICTQAGKQGLANNRGILVVFPKYDHLQDLNNGYVIASRNGKFGLLTQEGQSTIPMVYDEIIYDSRNEVYIVHDETQWEKL